MARILKINAMSLEELMVALAVIGVLTLILMDTWRMTSAVARGTTAEIDSAEMLCDSIPVTRMSVQEKHDAERLDSLKTEQERHEKTDD